jgi:uncharacterized protein (TIGR02145 family)
MSQNINPSEITSQEEASGAMQYGLGSPEYTYYGAEHFVICVSNKFTMKQVLYNPVEYFKDDFYIEILKGKCPLKKLKVGIWIDDVLFSRKNDGDLVKRHIGPLEDGSVIKVELEGARGGYVRVKITGMLKDDVIADVDGNYYKTVKIGEQVWMAENLRTTKYKDGTDIPYKKNGATYRWYNDDITFKKPYGALYTYETGATGLLAPSGWHIPSIEEWNQLKSYLESTGGDVGKALASKTGWASSPTPGTVGYDQAGNNRSGFNGLPAGGYLYSHPKYFGMGEQTDWTTSTKIAADPYLEFLSYTGSDLEQHFDSQPYALSVRCIKDS